MVLLNITSGWTERLGPFTLRLNGLPFALTGFTVAIVLHRSDGSSFTPGGTVVVDPDQVNNKGQVSYDPVATDFVWVDGGPVTQHYTIHWQVTDGAGKIVFFPNGAADEIVVYKP